LPPSAVCFTAALGGAIRRGRHGVEQPVLGLPPSAVCFTAAWDGSSISRGRTGVEQPVPALLPAPSVPRQRGTAQTTGASFAPSAVCSTAARHGTNNRCQLYSQRRLFHGGAAQREQPVPALPPAPSVLRRRKPLILVSNPPGSYPAYPRGDVRPGQSVSWALPRFDRASGYADSSHPHGAVGLSVCSTTARWRDQARPQRRKAAGARFAPSAVCFTAARWRDQPRPHRRRTDGARFVSQCCLPGPHRRGTDGARFVSQCCLPGPHRRRTAGARFVSQCRHRGRTGVEQPVLGLSPSAVIEAAPA